MKATPELLQQALRVLEIGLSPEISAKILATVRLLDEKGDSADLKDFALIEAAYSEKIEPEIINLANLEMCDTIELRNGDKLNISQVQNNGGDLYRLWHIVGNFNEYIGWFFIDGTCQSFNQNPADIERYDIVKIIKLTKPQ